MHRTRRSGSAPSSLPLYDGLKWAMAAKHCLRSRHGRDGRELRDLAAGIGELPEHRRARSELREAVREDLDAVADHAGPGRFLQAQGRPQHPPHRHEGRVAEAVARDRAKAQDRTARCRREELPLLPEWSEFTAEEQSQRLGRDSASGH